MTELVVDWPVMALTGARVRAVTGNSRQVCRGRETKVGWETNGAILLHGDNLHGVSTFVSV